MMFDTPIILSPTEIGSPLWAKVVEHCNRRIAQFHVELEGDLDAAATASRRGRIKELRALLTLGEIFPAAPE